MLRLRVLYRMMEKELVRKYFEGRCTAEELAVVLAWLNKEGADHALLQEIMEESWKQESVMSADNAMKSCLLSKLQQQLYPGGAEKPPVRLYPAHTEEPVMIGERSIRKKSITYGMVACVAGLLLLAAWVLRYYNQPVQLERWNTLANTGTGVKYCLLPDGTKIWLSQASTLYWAEPFAGSQRSVRIEGQAFLEVAQDKKHPFVVQSGSVMTRVLGTAFNIESYAEENEIKVSLIDGKVAVQHAATGNVDRQAADTITEILNAGEMLTYTKATGNTRKEELRVTAMADWTGGHLVFNEVTVKVALERLARLYHLNLHVQEGVNLDKNRFSTVFTTETPEQIIKGILFITDYTCRITGKDVEIRRK